VRQPTGLVLDKASVHRAARGKARQRAEAARGLPLLLRPSYSPELNRMGVLWRFCKQYWLPPAYQSLQTLREHVTKLLQNTGS